MWETGDHLKERRSCFNLETLFDNRLPSLGTVK